MSRFKRIDEIDIKLLAEIEKRPGQPLARATKVLLNRRSRRALYSRLYVLEAQQRISVDRSSERGLARATITEKGKAAIMGRENPYPSTEAGLS
ncbi:MAG TPA: hypothetical protein PLQ01_10230 [Methanothrix sp.]|nr:hypothetical protein [Methanothrix sp.]